MAWRSGTRPGRPPFFLDLSIRIPGPEVQAAGQPAGRVFCLQNAQRSAEHEQSAPTIRERGLFTGVLLPVLSAAHDHAEHPLTNGRTVEYVANHGQWPDEVRYKASIPTSAMFLQAVAVTWVRYQVDDPDLVHQYIQWSPKRHAMFTLQGHAWRMRFDGADPSAVVTGLDKLAAYHNYYLGDYPVIVGERVEYSYTDPGTYSITLTVNDLGCGPNDQTSQQVELTDALPVAVINAPVVCPDDVAALQVQSEDVTYL